MLYFFFNFEQVNFSIFPTATAATTTTAGATVATTAAASAAAAVTVLLWPSHRHHHCDSLRQLATAQTSDIQCKCQL